MITQVNMISVTNVCSHVCMNTNEHSTIYNTCEQIISSRETYCLRINFKSIQAALDHIFMRSVCLSELIKPISYVFLSSFSLYSNPNMYLHSAFFSLFLSIIDAQFPFSFPHFDHPHLLHYQLLSLTK